MCNPTNWNQSEILNSSLEDDIDVTISNAIDNNVSGSNQNEILTSKQLNSFDFTDSSGTTQWKEIAEVQNLF